MKNSLKDIGLILMGAFLFAVGVNYFTIPNTLSEGGILGITIITHYLFHWSPGVTQRKEPSKPMVPFIVS